MNRHVVLSGIGSAKSHVLHEVERNPDVDLHIIRNGFQVIQQSIGESVKSFDRDEIGKYLEMVGDYYINQESKARLQEKTVLQDGSLLDVVALGFGLVDKQLLETFTNVMNYKHKFYRVINLPIDEMLVNIEQIPIEYAERVNERIHQLIDYYNIPSIDFLSNDIKHQVAYTLGSVQAVKQDRDIYNEM